MRHSLYAGLLLLLLASPSLAPSIAQDPVDAAGFSKGAREAAKTPAPLVADGEQPSSPKLVHGSHSAESLASYIFDELRYMRGKHAKRLDHKGSDGLVHPTHNASARELEVHSERNVLSALLALYDHDADGLLSHTEMVSLKHALFKIAAHCPAHAAAEAADEVSAAHERERAAELEAAALAVVALKAAAARAEALQHVDGSVPKAGEQVDIVLPTAGTAAGEEEKAGVAPAHERVAKSSSGGGGLSKLEFAFRFDGAELHPKEQVGAIHEIFAALDGDRDGAVSAAEMKRTRVLYDEL